MSQHKKKAFLSYSSRNVEDPRSIVGSIEDRVDCFFDESFKGPAHDVWLWLEGELRNADAFVLILRRETMCKLKPMDSWVRMEITAANYFSVPVIPIIDAGVNWPGDLPDDLQKLPILQDKTPCIIQDISENKYDELVRKINASQPPPSNFVQGSCVIAPAIAAIASRVTIIQAYERALYESLVMPLRHAIKPADLSVAVEAALGCFDRPVMAVCPPHAVKLEVDIALRERFKKIHVLCVTDEYANITAADAAASDTLN